MRFKLLAQHYIDDRLLEPGTEVGDGTSVPFRFPDGSRMVPSTEMEGVDEEGVKAVEDVRSRSFPMFADLQMHLSGPDPTATVVDPTNAAEVAASEEPKGLTLPEPKRK